jgi:hypothetical protein
VYTIQGGAGPALLDQCPEKFGGSGADFALVRSKEELQQAADAHLNGAMIVNDDGLENLPKAADCLRLISVPGKFNYLSHGDICQIPSSFQHRSFLRGDGAPVDRQLAVANPCRQVVHVGASKINRSVIIEPS